MKKNFAKTVSNFGNNVRFRPRHHYVVSSENDVIEVMREHTVQQIRVMGSRHAWSPAIETSSVLLDVSQLDAVETDFVDDQVFATAGAGCKIKRLLAEINKQADVTLPSIGLINEQTIAGAISTGTHGSGKSSLSHYIQAVRLAVFDAETGEPKIVEISGGDELRAARCALGCMGIILSVKFKCVPRYLVLENAANLANFAEAMESEKENPLQQFYLIPHSWKFLAQQRKAIPFEKGKISRLANLYRLYMFLSIDVLFHVIVKTLAAAFKSKAGIKTFYRHLFPRIIVTNWRNVDYSERQLVMEHELFRHLEMELFVQRSQLEESLEFAREVLTFCDGESNVLSPNFQNSIDEFDLAEDLKQLQGTFTHHYPICIRRIQSDDTLISMASPAAHEESDLTRREDWYAISLITYVEPREEFFEVARFLAISMTKMFSARVHWGKHCPLDHSEIEAVYPNLEKFREIVEQFDPEGNFRNEFVDRALGLRHQFQNY